MALALSLCVFGPKRKKMSKRDYVEIGGLFNAWLFACIWLRPVWHKLPSILNGSQESPGFGSAATTSLSHVNCSDQMLHRAQPSTDKPVICQAGCVNQTRNRDIPYSKENAFSVVILFLTFLQITL